MIAVALDIGPNYPVFCMTDIISSAQCVKNRYSEKGTSGKFLKVLIWVKVHVFCPGKHCIH